MVAIFIRPTSSFHGKEQKVNEKTTNENKPRTTPTPSKGQSTQMRKVSKAVPPPPKDGIIYVPSFLRTKTPLGILTLNLSPTCLLYMCLVCYFAY